MVILRTQPSNTDQRPSPDTQNNQSSSYGKYQCLQNCFEKVKEVAKAALCIVLTVLSVAAIYSMPLIVAGKSLQFVISLELQAEVNLFLITTITAIATSTFAALKSPVDILQNVYDFFSKCLYKPAQPKSEASVNTTDTKAGTVSSKPASKRRSTKFLPYPYRFYPRIVL